MPGVGGIQSGSPQGEEAYTSAGSQTTCTSTNQGTTGHLEQPVLGVFAAGVGVHHAVSPPVQCRLQRRYRARLSALLLLQAARSIELV